MRRIRVLFAYYTNDLGQFFHKIGPVLQSAERLHDEIQSTVGINASIGIASNKLLAKIASDAAKPNGMLWIAPGMEKKFLAPLAIDRVPGIGPKSSREFRRMGIKTINDLASLPKELLEEVYGKWGAALYHKSRGVCLSPVVGEAEENRSISRYHSSRSRRLAPLKRRTASSMNQSPRVSG